MKLNKKTEEHQGLVIREFGEMMKQLRAEMEGVLQQSAALTKRTEEHQKAVLVEFAETMRQMRAKVEQSLGEPMKLTAQYITSMEAGLQGLNKVLGELGEKRIVVEVKKKSWFGRS